MNTPKDYWNPDPEDPFWMLEAEDGEWLKNTVSMLGTRDPAKAIRFPTYQAANDHPARMRTNTKWWAAKPTEHSWIIPTANPSIDGAAEVERIMRGFVDTLTDCGRNRGTCLSIKHDELGDLIKAARAALTDRSDAVASPTDGEGR